MVTVRDLMTSVVQTLSIGDTLAQAHRQMEKSHIRHLPVVDDAEQLIGLLTHRMVLAAWVGQFEQAFARGDQSSREVGADVPVEMIMQKNVVTVSPDLPAEQAALIMETQKFGCLPVVEGGKLIGILTEHDFVRFARHSLEMIAAGSAPYPE
jgi:CBS domain-containing membrane protein